MKRLIPYFATLVVFVVMDAVWLTLTARFYRAQLNDLLLASPRILPAAVFYLLFVLGIQIFVLPRAGSAATALAFGAGFGIFTYATYDLTNWAILRDWTASLTIMDICWGAIVTAIASMAGHLVQKYFHLA